MAKFPFLAKATSWLLNKLGELVIWAVCVVLISVFPIYVVYFIRELKGAPPIPIKELVGKGELLLVAAALGADSISRILSRLGGIAIRAAWRRFIDVVLLLASFSFVLVAAAKYAVITYAIDPYNQSAINPGLRVDAVFQDSSILFLATLLIGTSVILSD